MTDVYLEVTYRGGRPWVAYLYLARKKKEKSDHCREVEPDMVLDINKEGRLIGIELLDPALVTLDAINAILEEYRFEPLQESDLAPLWPTRSGNPAAAIELPG
jgi:uncharacterized protein YuzE